MPKIKEEPKKTGKEETTGWGAVAKRKKDNDEASASTGNRVYDLIIKDGESVIIQFLDDEPYCFDAHQVKVSGKWKTLACQLAKQDHCLLCEEDIKKTWKAAFKVLDYRGEWDKDKKKYKAGSPPVLKVWKCSNTLALQIHALVEKKGKPLSEQVFEVTRTGAGAKDTSYNFQTAFDEETERKLKPIEYDDESAATKTICAPLPDVVLEKMGFSSSETVDEEDD